MKGGILEVFLEGAKGIRRTNLIGKPKYYVIIECGIQHYKSKSSKGDHHNHKVTWNEKFTFELSMSECQKLTHLRLRIMDKELFANDTGFVGEAWVSLEDIIMEGNEKGLIEMTPKPYNVVLDDETFKGEINIGLKFFPNTFISEKGRGVVTFIKTDDEQTMWNKLVNFCKRTWRKLSSYGRKLNANEYKRI